MCFLSKHTREYDGSRFLGVKIRTQNLCVWPVAYTLKETALLFWPNIFAQRAAHYNLCVFLPLFYFLISKNYGTADSLSRVWLVLGTLVVCINETTSPDLLFNRSCPLTFWGAGIARTWDPFPWSVTCTYLPCPLGLWQCNVSEMFFFFLFAFRSKSLEGTFLYFFVGFVILT